MQQVHASHTESNDHVEQCSVAALGNSLPWPPNTTSGAPVVKLLDIVPEHRCYAHPSDDHTLVRVSFLYGRPHDHRSCRSHSSRLQGQVTSSSTTRHAYILASAVSQAEEKLCSVHLTLWSI